MDFPKQKEPMKKPKVKTKSTVRAKNLSKTIDNTKKHIDIKENNEGEYSVNRFEEMAKDTAKVGVEIAYRGARAGYQNAKQSTNRNNTSYNLNEKQNDIKSKPIVSSKQKEQASNIKSKQAVINKQKSEAISYKSKVNTNIELAKRKAYVKSAKKQAEIKDIKIKSAVTSPKNAIFTGKKGNYVDCSYLTRWCYLQAGVSHFTAGTAASQAEYCVNNGLTIAKSDLQAGDLVYWSHKANGRFMNITHTGVYAGDGMVIDASFSRGMVVYRPLFYHDKQVVYARPHVR